MKALFTAFSAIASLAALAQTAPPIQRQESLGGTFYDDASCIRQTSDGGYIVSGYSYSNDGDVGGHHGTTSWADYWIVKLRKNGEIQRQESLGGSSSDVANCVQQTSDSGYIVAGYSFSKDGDVTGHHGTTAYPDYWIVKLMENGDIQWQKSLGGSFVEYGYSIQQTSDGGYIVAGYSNSNDGDVSGNHGAGDYWIVKLKKNGGIEWQKSLGGNGDDGAQFVQQTSDSGYIVAGFSFSNDGDVIGHHGEDDYWIVKLTKYGDIAWQKSLGGSSYDGASCIRQTQDGGYIVVGDSWSTDGDVTGNHGLGDYWIVKLKKNGDIAWQKSLGGSRSDVATYVQQTSDSAYIIAGYSHSDDGDVSGHHYNSNYADYWIVKLTKNGDLEWQKSLGGTYDEWAYSIQQTPEGGYIIAGPSYSNDGDVTGHHGSNGSADYWLVKLGKDGSPLHGPATSLYPASQNKNTKQAKQQAFTVYPNPAKNILYLQTKGSAVFSFINSYGKILLTKTINGNSSLHVNGLPPGIYYVKNNKTGEVQKLIVDR